MLKPDGTEDFDFSNKRDSLVPRKMEWLLEVKFGN